MFPDTSAQRQPPADKLESQTSQFTSATNCPLVAPSAVRATCAFVSKKPFFQQTVFAVSRCRKSTKNFFDFSDFPFLLPALFVEIAPCARQMRVRKQNPQTLA